MRFTFPALIALLVAVATVAAGSPVQLPLLTDSGVESTSGSTTADQQPLSSSIEVNQNTSAQLTLASGAQSTARFENATLDVTGTVAMERAQLQTLLNETATRQAFKSAEADIHRTAIIRHAANNIQNRTIAFQTRQERVIAAYNRGELSSEELLHRIAVIDAKSRQMEQYISEIRYLTDQTPGYSLPSSLREQLKRYGSLEATSSILQGPIRDTVSQSLSGERTDTTIYIETSNNGIVLSRISGNRYIREGFLASEFQQNTPDKFAVDSQVPLQNISSAYNRVKKLYPWTFNNSLSVSLDRFSGTTIYEIRTDHIQGNINTYLDGLTANVFREIQRKRLFDLSLTGNATSSTKNITITAGISEQSGPMNISVVDTETGYPMDARVTLNGQFVGQTGSDGILWTIRPQGQVTINATTSTGDNATLNLGKK